MRRPLALLLLTALAPACGDDNSSGNDSTNPTITSASQPGTTTDPATTADPIPTTGATTTGPIDDSGTTAEGPRLDLPIPDAGGPAECAAEQHTPCDEVDGDPIEAIGLCPGEATVTGGFNGHAEGLRVLSQWGQAATFTPREGQSFLVLSTGDLAQRSDVPADEGDVAYHCNSWFAGGDGMDTTKLPPPLTTKSVDGDCLGDPSLLGTGDCSNSIQQQFDQSGFKYDYQELRLTLTVPPGAESLSLDFAFLTKEYPIWKDRPYNDMFVAWLESEHWTGNIAFDMQGNPLSLNAAFLELYDDQGDLPEFAGTCMRYSAGTRWLTSTADVVPGESIDLILAIFDLDDVNWDSFVLVDNVRWGCGDTPGPITEPAG
jgi:hypothetical protein